jgi:hypothetical protein
MGARLSACCLHPPETQEDRVPQAPRAPGPGSLDYWPEFWVLVITTNKPLSAREVPDREDMTPAPSHVDPWQSEGR